MRSLPKLRHSLVGPLLDNVNGTDVTISIIQSDNSQIGYSLAGFMLLLLLCVVLWKQFHYKHKKCSSYLIAILLNLIAITQSLC